VSGGPALPVAGAPTLGPNGVGGPVAPGLRSPLPTRQRRPGYALLAVVLIAGLAAVGAYLYTQAGAKVPVVMVVNDVPAGHPISRSDLTTVPVAGGVTAIAGANLESVVGKTAAVRLLPDMLLQRSMVTDSSALPAGRSLVGVVVRPGQIPADGLAAGDRVDVVLLPPKDGPVQGGAATVLVARALVFSSRPDPSSQGGTLLSLIVPDSAGTGVAAASSAGRVALVKVTGS
jgi:hypothetical protein